jgi:phage terminase large subunit-like protein
MQREAGTAVTSVLEPTVRVERVCVGCGETFVDAKRSGAPRSYCDGCRVGRRPGRTQSPQAREPVRGRPFTVAHFRRWATPIELPDGRFRLEPFQEAFVSDVFALRGKPSEALLIVPEGNGKSSLIALLALYFLEHVQEAAIPVGAATRDQAYNVLFACMDGIIRRSSLGQFKVHPGLRKITCEATSGAIQVYAAEAGGADGIQPRGLILIDELHRLKSLGPGSLYRTWVGKLEKADATLVGISTAGAPDSEFEELRQQFRTAGEVAREGCFLRAVGERSVLHEYALPEDADPDDLALVAQANPLSKITVERLRAKREAPSFNLAHWRRFTCNMPTRETDAAITEREWHDAATAERIPRDAEVWVGLDVGWRWDTTAFVPFWWRDEEFRLFGPAKILTPPQDGSSMDPRLVKRAFTELQDRYRITTVVMDTNRAEDIASWLSDEGLLVVDRAQTNKPQVEDYERFMEALRQGWLRHSADEGLRRHAMNAVARVLEDGSVRFDRPERSRSAPKQSARVIDALRAASMVHSVAVEMHATPPRPRYRAGGFT